MTAEPWVPIEKRREDAEHTGPLPPGFNLGAGVPWSDIPKARAGVVPRKMLAGKKERSEPDWIDVRQHSDADPQERPDHFACGAWEFEGLPAWQADVARFVYTNLYAGTLRAFGHRAAPDAPYEWIPRREWLALENANQGNAWWAMFRGINAFKLAADEPAWCDVRVMECRPVNPNILTAARQGVREPPTIQGFAIKASEPSGMSDPGAQEPRQVERPKSRPGRKPDFPTGDFLAEAQRVRDDPALRGGMDFRPYMIQYAGKSVRSKHGKSPSDDWVDKTLRLAATAE